MKPIPLTIYSHGGLKTQIFREGNAAVYRVDTKPPHFEAIVIGIAKANFIDGKWQESGEPREIYPSSEQWGTKGFTFSPASHENPEAAAIEMAKQLCAR